MTELERSEVAGQCNADRILRTIQAADVGAAMVYCRPRQDSNGHSGSAFAETETPQRFLRIGTWRYAAATARTDLFPGLEDRQRTGLEGAASASQGSVFQWHHRGPLSRHRLDADFAAATAQ